jgi:glycogen operon protein
MRVLEGLPHPIGATWDGRGTNFALFSAHAEKVELCLFDRQGRRELERVALPECTDYVWHGYLPEVMPGQRYGYRAHGPYEPERGHRFNPNKLLFDPYAKRIAGRFVWSDAHFGYRTGSARADLSFDRRDNSRGLPKSVVVDEAFTWGDDRSPNIPWHDTIIYEAHVKGLTVQRSDVPPGWRGSFRGLAAPGLINHLKRLGVTSLELLPIHAFVDDRHLVEQGLKNYWGYNTIGFFAPEPRYAAESGLNAFQSTVRQLHEAGIEVILDVVYNHTAEGNELGPTLCFRGIDNASYYWLRAEAPRYYENFTGCGNSLNLSHPRVLQLVMDSLRYWVQVGHVDGFRFDLATTLGRTQEGFSSASGFLSAVAQDPVLAKVKLIAEPWDVGLGGYQVGAFPPGWSEWNDAFRHTARRYWRGDGNLIGDLSTRLTGSSDLFRHNGRSPRASINHLTAHDGFTLADLVSYAEKHNEANGDDNRDGGDNNHSSNWGVEGPSDDPAIIELRRRIRKNLLATLLLAQGVPMLLGGDEIANSQAGNNNAYCQDNEIGWIDWSKLGTDEDLTDFIAQLTQLRRQFPQLQGHRWLSGARKDGSRDVLWLTPQGNPMTEEDWSFPEARFLSYVLAPMQADGTAIFIVFNAAPEPIKYLMPTWTNGERWRQVLGTGSISAENETFPANTEREAEPRSVTVYAAES